VIVADSPSLCRRVTLICVGAPPARSSANDCCRGYPSRSTSRSTTMVWASEAAAAAGEQASETGTDDHHVALTGSDHGADALLLCMPGRWHGQLRGIRVKHICHCLTLRIRHQRTNDQGHRHRDHRGRQQPSA
jgi:hypothetical protein